MLAKKIPLLMFCTLTACVNLDPAVRRQDADALAAAHGWKPMRLRTGEFTLAAYATPATAGQILTIYIEGDGLAWLTRSQASGDPTPRRPLALELALRHPHGSVAYLARPCQFVEGEDRRGCDTDFWTSRRFAPQVIAASNQAIDALKAHYGVARLALVGYSGGGAVAALVAARRKDVVRLVTVAGNLDHQAWTRLHGVPPLDGSLNPADAWDALQDVPQLHFVGARDANITAQVAASYAARFPQARRPAIRSVDGFSHTCCWVEQWPVLALQAFPQSEAGRNSAISAAPSR
ncbi:hypothetical protein EDC30_103280 [Paucimonas lemoignei]|uniref:Alpha/beta hydrolase n=1 Tax=Paucimonas lemoignei TaxID=29443 RepID=A0A4R3HXT6_PAULE|nr:alpha/beta hydrolase [Paucimonas lemoignei]TCS37988.1 hypothetical protein EDC30_103280 [Paucimonas lemoignei]